MATASVAAMLALATPSSSLSGDIVGGASAEEVAFRASPVLPLDTPICPFSAALYPLNSGDFGRLVVLHQHDGDVTDDPKITLPSRTHVVFTAHVDFDCRAITVTSGSHVDRIDIATGAVTPISVSDFYDPFFTRTLTTGELGHVNTEFVRTVGLESRELMRDWNGLPIEKADLSRDGRVIAGWSDGQLAIVSGDSDDAPVFVPYPQNGRARVAPAGSRVLTEHRDFSSGASEIIIYAVDGTRLRTFRGQDMTNARFLDDHTVVVCDRDGMYRSDDLGPLRQVESFSYTSQPSPGGPAFPWSPAHAACASAT